MVVEIQLFGVLRRFAPAGSLRLDVPIECSAAELRALLKRRLQQEYKESYHPDLIDKAALADETKLLEPAALIKPGAALALLPPVCGG